MPSTTPRPELLYLGSDGRTPNNPLPVLLYRQLALQGDQATAFEERFASHLWPPRWRSVVFDYQHFHSTAHEALGVAQGWANLLLGGEQGQVVNVQAGDALVLPAGTGHCQLQASADFMVVLAYPLGQEPDNVRPDAAGHDAACERIAQVPTPVSDPLAGPQGALVEAWRRG